VVRAALGRCGPIHLGRWTAEGGCPYISGLSKIVQMRLGYNDL
jgi:hypothetical protein